MTLNIELTPAQETAITAAARFHGIAPAELVKQLAMDHLPSVPTIDNELDEKLHQWQLQDGRELTPDVPAPMLFAQWDEEDAQMTQEEREAEDRFWEDLEKGLTNNNRILQLRRIG